jgi:hypothetical protein
LGEKLETLSGDGGDPQAARQQKIEKALDKRNHKGFIG